MRYWPRTAPGLPPGQRRLTDMPRFGDQPRRPPPDVTKEPRLDISLDGRPLAVVTGADLQALGPREHRSDFHCVTTWSVTELAWTGVPLHEVLGSVGVTDAPAPYLVARGADQGRAVLCWEDALAPEVILATRLNGAALDDRSGGPLRLVSPGQYGYKSVKHLVAIDLRTTRPRLPGKEHLRARVAQQERHPRLPGRIVAPFYRLLIPATAYLGERTLRRHRAGH